MYDASLKSGQPAEAGHPMSTPVASHVDTRPYLLERVERSRRRPALCRRVRRAAAPREDPDLSPVPGGARRPRHLLRPALRAQPRRCATCSRRSSRIRTASTEATLAEIRRYTKLFWINTGPYNNLTARKFVAEVPARGIRGRGRAGRVNGATLPAAERRDPRRTADAARSAVLRSRRSIRS